VSGSLLYFKFDESAGSSAFDSSGSGLTGSLVNGPVWVSGRSGNGLQFDGVNDYVRVGDVLDIYDRITLSVWIKPATVSRDQDIVCKDWQTSYMGYEFGINSAGELMFRINPTSSSYAYRTSSGAGITTNTWQHVAVTFDGTNVRFYKNGALITTVAGSGRLYSSSEVVYVGTYETTGMYVFSGALDELRIYNRQLSSSEINQLYTSLQGEGLTTTSTTSVSTTTTRITTTTTTTSTTRTTTTTTNTTTTSTPLTCRVGSGYTFTGVGSYTASSSSGVPSISRSGQYTFYETPHDYTDYLTCSWSGTYTCPTGTNIRFYLRAQTEEGYDYFNIRNSAGTTYEEMSGDNGASYSWTSTYTQRTAAFNFVSDDSSVDWGVDLYRIECISSATTTTTTTSTTITTIAGNGATYVSQSSPTTSMCAGATQSMSVTMRNTGSTTWTASGNYRLGSQNPQDNTNWGLARVPLDLTTSESIAPGASKTFAFTIKAPSTAGTYNLQWRMLQEGVAWFGGQSTNIQIAVSSCSATTTTRSTTTTISGECYGAIACNPTGNPIGGGSGYSRIVTSGTVTVTNKAQLLTALQSASSGTVIFIPSGYTIDMTGTASVTIPAGVTLASNRGSGGASGAVIKRTENLNGGWEEPMFIAGGNNVRVTGLVLEGEMYPQDYGNNDVYPGSINERYYLVGIYANGRSGLEVDNCELRGWAWSAISIRQCNNAYIHHNYIHHNQARGEGYGTNLYGGSALLEANIYDYNRHDITGAGMVGEKYEARYNRILGHGNAIGAANFDVHQDEEGGTGGAGEKFLIHHNTVDGGVVAFVHIRADPSVGCYVDHNIINSAGTDTGTRNGMPIWQSNVQGNMFVTNNYWKGTFYPTGADISYFG
jgi:hypothetical protein